MSYLLCTCTSCVLYVNKSLTLFPYFFTLYNESDVKKHALWFIKLNRIQDASITSMVVTVHAVKRLGRLGGILCVKSGQKINFLACRQPFLDQIFYIGVPLPRILNLVGFFRSSFSFVHILEMCILLGFFSLTSYEKIPAVELALFWQIFQMDTSTTHVSCNFIYSECWDVPFSVGEGGCSNTT